MSRFPPPGKPRPWATGESAIYHITDVENLPSILKSGSVLCDKQCAGDGVNPVSIAYANLKEKRANTRVTVSPGGTLADYVPFYFAPRSPMLYVNWKGGVEGYGKGQDQIIHLVACIESCATQGEFVIVDGHPISPLSKQSDSLEALDGIDWEIMRTLYWRDTDEDGDRKRRRQAEFLKYRSVSFSEIRQIGVKSEVIAAAVQAKLDGIAEPPAVVVRRDWYY